MYVNQIYEFTPRQRIFTNFYNFKKISKDQQILRNFKTDRHELSNYLQHVTYLSITNKSTDLIISASDIHVKLSQLKTGKSPGPDQIHPRILYETRDVVYYPLFLIFNQSFKTGVLPYDWKLAEVTAVHKKRFEN